MTRLATWNVNGIRARQGQFLDWLAAETLDIVCLQEIKAAPHQLEETLCELPGYWCAWHGGGPYSGVALQLRRESFPVAPAFFHPAFDFEHRAVCAELSGGLVVASLYVPNGGKDYPAKLAFLHALGEWVGEQHAAGRRLILAGDLNVAREERDVHPKERKATAIGQLPEERALLAALLERGLVDLGRHFAPEDDGLFTWWAPWRNLRQRNIGWRIDYVLASDGLLPVASGCRVQREVGTSDHAPVLAELALESAAGGGA